VIRKCLWFLPVLLLHICAWAQSGKISGKVLNIKNEPLHGVSVKISGAPGGTTTDQEGRFIITVPAGKKYELQFSAVGYESKTVDEIEVSAEKLTDLPVMLDISGKSLGEVTVTATRTSARKETVNSLIQFQKNTNTVAAVISAESIRRSPDKNTGEVLKRVPGTSIQEGKYLVVRGLSDRYNQAMLNGIQLSSTEPDRKTFSFDLFPSAAIDNIIINKAFVPEYPGEWAGGLVQVNTKDIPANNFFTLQLGTGFNTQTIGRDFYTYKGGSLDFLGIEDGSRALPASFPTKSRFNVLQDAEKTSLGKNFVNDWSVHQAGIPLNTSLQASGGLNTKLLGKDFGAIVSLTYNRSNRRVEYENSIYNIERGKPEAQVSFDYFNNRYSQDVLAGALANFSLKLDNNNRINFRNILNVNSTDYTVLRTGKDYEASAGQQGENIRARELAFKTNTFLNSQLGGEHSISLHKLKTKLNWFGSFGILDQYIPQQRRLQYNQIAEGDPYMLLIGESLSQKSGSIFYSNLSDYIYNAGGDLTTPFGLFNRKQTIKMGYLFQVKDRLYDARPFSINLKNSTSPLRLLDEDHVFSPENFSNGSEDEKFGFSEIGDNRFRYMANSILNAGYIQFDNQLADWLRIVWGVRYEHFDQVVGSLKASDDRHVYSKVGDFLPAFNTTFKVNNKTNVRFTASQTVVRPEFRELSPLAFYDFELGATVVGNKSLVRTKITNLDLRYELYPRAGELFTLGVFYKYFRDPIEQNFNQSGAGSSSTFNYLNVEKATGYGVEFEMRKKLDFADVLKNFTFQTNLSYIYNKVEDPEVKISRPMQGQSPYVINASLQYDLPGHGLSTTLLFNQIGRRILYVGNDQVPEIWEAPRPLLDLQIAKKFAGNKAEIRLGISDIINKKAVFYHDQDNNGSFNSSTVDKIAIRRLYGTNVSVSLGYNF
jgi:outer membrane receptor for ferrienterochelin and colicin